MNYPSEDFEQKQLVLWLRRNKIPHHHSANEMWTSSFKQKARNKAMGVSSGFPDLVIAIPPDMARNGSGIVLAIELKRQRGGRTTPNQRMWLALLNRTGVPAQVCNGKLEAIKFISQYLYKDSGKEVF